jgi:hypothetical protein
LFSLGIYFIDIVIVYLEKHDGEICSGFYMEGVEVGQLFESSGFRENGGKPKQVYWP